jgi:hypothetical protein
MATGYTQKILDGATPREFALECARAFGALIEMRDDPMGLPIPAELEDQDSERYKSIIEKAQKRIKHVKKMSLARAAKHAQNDYDNAKNYHTAGIQEKAENCFKLAKVMAEVASYTPPTPDHENYKEFMLTQVAETVDWDGNPEHHTKELAKLRVLSPQEWKAKQIERAQWDVDYYTKQLNEHQERHAGRNQWLQDLHRSSRHFTG